MGSAKIMRTAESHVEFSLTSLSVFVIYIMLLLNTNKIYGTKNYKANKNMKIFLKNMVKCQTTSNYSFFSHHLVTFKILKIKSSNS